MQAITPIAASYRDKDGFVFTQNGIFYRLIQPSYFADYTLLMQSGLYEDATQNGRLIAHQELDATAFEGLPTTNAKIILPTQLPFISYPYEWPFAMWKDAAIVTLQLLKQAIEKGMVLKDATPFNIQFYNGRPVFIDTLSFTKYDANKPWVAYNQFCESFLAPLLLMHYGHRDLGKIFLLYPNGIPLEILTTLLPFTSKFNLPVYLHIWLQAKVSAKNSNTKSFNTTNVFSKQKLLSIIDSLLGLVKRLDQKKSKSTWDDYYTQTILGNDYLQAKTIIFNNFIDSITFKTVIDLGANDGYFSLLVKNKTEHILAIDIDANCINNLYKKLRADKIKNIVPIVSTLNIPTPAIGWANEERTSLTQRLTADVVFALALVHHLAIANNVPLPFIAKWLSQMGQYLIIEFIPKTDEKVQQLLSNRADIFTQYDKANFVTAFQQYFAIITQQKVGNTDRVLFLMKKIV